MHILLRNNSFHLLSIFNLASTALYICKIVPQGAEVDG